MLRPALLSRTQGLKLLHGTLLPHCDDLHLSCTRTQGLKLLLAAAQTSLSRPARFLYTQGLKLLYGALLPHAGSWASLQGCEVWGSEEYRCVVVWSDVEWWGMVR
jgi:hypothetical protein